jgi:hypothetical protein
MTIIYKSENLISVVIYDIGGYFVARCWHILINIRYIVNYFI